MAGQYIKYGAYQHPPYEAGIMHYEAIARRSPRGFVTSTVMGYQVHGDLVLLPGEDEFDLDTRINDLQAAYLSDGLDWGLYHADNSPTPHFLQNNHPQSMTGNQIVYRQFPSGHGGEYSTGREFTYKIQNEFLTPDSLIIEYSETVSHQGTTGPRYEWRFNKFQIPYFERTASSTLQRITQHGHAITLSAYLIPPEPIAPRPFELEHLRTITRTGPRRFPRGFTFYRIDWTYHYLTPVIIPALPRTR